MIAGLTILLTVTGAVVLFVATFFFLEVAAAFASACSAPGAASRRETRAASDERGPATIVVPAHNEEGGLGAALANFREQLRIGDRLIVVADNCDDATARIAEEAGAECLRRLDPTRRGKGYALQFAIERLRPEPPQTVVFLDADCRLAPRALDRLVIACRRLDAPVQGLYLMQPGPGAPAAQAIAAFAWVLINRVRMAGLYRLFGVTRLTGAGMALPWRIAGALNLANGEIVEDLALSLKLTKAGEYPHHVGDAVITSEFPTSTDGAASQRARWEIGSLALAARTGPALAFRGLATGDIRLLAVAADLAIPPLTVLAALILVQIGAGALLVLSGGLVPLVLGLVAGLVAATGVAAGWAGFGRDALTLSASGRIGAFLALKARVYGPKARATTRTWTRAERPHLKAAGDAS